MAPDQSEYKIQNAPLMTEEQRTVLANLLGGYMNMMEGTKFGQAYPGATRSGYTPKTFKGPFISYKKDKNGSSGSWKWKSSSNPTGPPTVPGWQGGPPLEPNPNPQPGQPPPPPGPYPEPGQGPITNVLARQYTNPLTLALYYGLTGNYPKSSSKIS